MQKNNKIIIWVVVLVIAAAILFMALVGSKPPVAVTPVPPVVMPPVPPVLEATLTLDPQTKAVKIGETFAVDIVLDTGGNPIDGVDLYSVHYNPKIVSVVDDNAQKSGVQIAPGTILAVNAMNNVDQEKGMIKFSQVSQGGTNYTGKGVLATIHFKALATGNTDLKFDFTPGSTKDTNAAHAGMDQLSNVANAIYTVDPK